VGALPRFAVKNGDLLGSRLEVINEAVDLIHRLFADLRGDEIGDQCIAIQTQKLGCFLNFLNFHQYRFAKIAKILYINQDHYFSISKEYIISNLRAPNKKFLFAYRRLIIRLDRK
jgi:hypothetical protein